MSTVPPLHALEGNGSGVPGPIGAYAVWGDSENGEGVLGNSKGGDGVFGQSEKGQGVVGLSGSSNGVSGSGSTGVHGYSNSGVGVYGALWVASQIKSRKDYVNGTTLHSEWLHWCPGGHL